MLKLTLQLFLKDPNIEMLMKIKMLMKINNKMIYTVLEISRIARKLKFLTIMTILILVITVFFKSKFD